MVRLKTSFASLITQSVVALHVVLLPALYFALGYVVRTSQEDQFIQHARTFARVLAEEFEISAALDSPLRTVDLLDVAVTHGDAVYAQLEDHGKVIRSSLGREDAPVPRRTDLRFAQPDDVYFILLPIVRAGGTAELQFGFDEQPTKQRIAIALDRMLIILAVYLCIVVALAVLFSMRLSRPIRRLKNATRSIASGNYSEQLTIGTKILELSDLGVDLEAMRRELVGVNERLQAQIREKEASELRREELQKQLRHRQRLETVGTLAGGIAHEFNNVLVPILLFTDAAISDLPPNSPAHSDLERVLESARRAKDVVHKLLTFSRVLGDAKLGPVDMRVVIEEALALFSTFVSPNILIRRQIEGAIAPIRGDPALATQLVMNLCSNALQAMHGTEGTLTIGLRQAGPRTEFWVSDTGHGMDKSTLERVFEPFFTTRNVGEGTGLGLSVVHGIVESFAATIAVESTPGSGTTFRILFPALQSSVAVEAATGLGAGS